MPVWTSASTKRVGGGTGRGGTAAGRAREAPAERSTPTTSPPGATAARQRNRQATAPAADVADPLARSGVEAFTRCGVTASVRRSRLGHAATHRSSFQRLVSASLATATR